MIKPNNRTYSNECHMLAGERTIRRGRPPIGGQDREGASYRCSAPYTLSRFAGLPLKGKRENRWHLILCHI